MEKLTSIRGIRVACRLTSKQASAEVSCASSTSPWHYWAITLPDRLRSARAVRDHLI